MAAMAATRFWLSQAGRGELVERYGPSQPAVGIDDRHMRQARLLEQRMRLIQTLIQVQEQGAGLHDIAGQRRVEELAVGGEDGPGLRITIYFAAGDDAV